VKLETVQKPIDPYRLATGLGRVAENTNICQVKTAKLQKYFISVAQLLPICLKTPSVCCVCFVSLVWTRHSYCSRTLRLLFHERFLEALPRAARLEIHWFKWTYFHERTLQRCRQGHALLRLLFHERFLAALAGDTLVQMDVLPRAYATALPPRSCAANAASRADRRFPAAGSGGFMPRC
jgi:hypothetical protein